MQQLFHYEGKPIIIEVPIPYCAENEVLVKNYYSAVSGGTEKALLEYSGQGTIGKVVEDRALIIKAFLFLKEKGLSETLKQFKIETTKELRRVGYSSCGEVIQVGKKINNLSVGDIVVCAGAGVANHAEFVAVPRNLCCRIPESVSPRDAAFTTIGAIALQGVRRSDVHIGDVVAVVGLGLLGLIAVQLLNAAGCRVIGIDVSQEKIDFASNLGLEKGFVADDGLIERVNSYCDGVGVDRSIIYASTSSNKPVHQAIGYTRKKGRIIVVGTVGMEIPWRPFYEKELDFGISCSYGPGRYDRSYEEKGLDYPIQYVRWSENRNMQEFLRLLAQKKVDIEKLLDKEYNFEQAADAYNKLDKIRTKPGVVFVYPEGEKDVKKTLKLNVGRKADKSKITVGVIGAGNFAQFTHLPNIEKSDRFNLLALATKSGDNAKKIGGKFGAKYCTTDYKEILEDVDIDLVILSTRHNLHAQIVIDSIKAGKNIFVEKPLCLTEKELTEIETLLSHADVNLCIGFNRRFAPAVLKAKSFIEKNNLLEKGMLINFRVNSAGMRNNPWVNDPEEGGGAIVGEACHFFDLMNYFMDSTPKEIQTSMVSSDDDSIVAGNNIIATIKYENGSLGSFLYSTIGTNRYPNERFEFFGKDTVIYIDDYDKILIEGLERYSKKFRKMDKGHFALLEEYGKFLAKKSDGENLPINETAIRSMRLTFDVVRNLKNEV